MRRLAPILAILAALALPAAAQTPVSLDRFLAGLDTACDTSPDFGKFRQTLAGRFPKIGAPNLGPTVIPPDIRPAVGRATSVEKREYTEVTVPLAGATWRGLPVAAIELSMGHENGISVVVVIFAVPKTRVEAVFGRTVAATARKLKAQAGEGAEFFISLGATGGRGTLICNQST